MSRDMPKAHFALACVMIQIRVGERHDLPFIVEAQLAMALETEGLQLVHDTVTSGVGYMFDHPERGFYLLAEAAGQTIGCMLVLKEWSDWRNGDVWWLHSVFVQPRARKTGCFRALYADVTQRAHDHEARGLRLYVDKTNARAQAVYAAMGMSDAHYTLFEKLF